MPRPFRAFLLLGLFVGGLLAAGVDLATPAAAGPVDPSIDLPISVRTHVEKPFGGFRRKPRPVFGKVYAIVSIDQTEEGPPIVKPISKNALLAHLRVVLSRQGFREIVAGETPDIILTVLYGRGFLRNPYMRGVIENNLTNPPSITVLGATPEHLIRQRQAHFESKLQKAQAEKLFIRVTAWSPPTASSADGEKNAKSRPKPELLWHTTMIYDDARRDLNLVFKDMLEAGGPFFDREIEVEEVEIKKGDLKGSVEVGTPEVVEPGTR